MNGYVARSGADPGFEKGGFDVVPKSDTGGATHGYLWKHHQESMQRAKNNNFIRDIKKLIIS